MSVTLEDQPHFIIHTLSITQSGQTKNANPQFFYTFLACRFIPSFSLESSLKYLRQSLDFNLALFHIGNILLSQDSKIAAAESRLAGSVPTERKEGKTAEFMVTRHKSFRTTAMTLNSVGVISGCTLSRMKCKYGSQILVGNSTKTY